MIGARNQRQLLWLGQACDEGFELRTGPELVAISTAKQFGLGASLQKAQIVGAIIHRRNRRAETNQANDTIIATRSAQANGCAERKSAEHERQVEFPRQPIEPGANVVNFALAIVVFTLTQTRTAKVKAKDGPAKTMQRFRRMKDDFVVKRPAKLRVRMTHDGGMRCRAAANIEQRF